MKAEWSSLLIHQFQYTTNSFQYVLWKKGIFFKYLSNFKSRFGDTRCLVSTRKILKGEEITVNYGYNMKSKKIPRWFRKLYQETFPDEEENEWLFSKIFFKTEHIFEDLNELNNLI